MEHTLIVETTLELMDFCSQIGNLIGLGNGLIAGDGLIGTFGGISMGTTSMAWFDSIALKSCTFFAIALEQPIFFLGFILFIFSDTYYRRGNIEKKNSRCIINIP